MTGGNFRLAEAAMTAIALLAIGTGAAHAVGPSFDCTRAATPAQKLVCSDPDLSRTELEYTQAYYAMRYQVGEAGWPSLKAEAILSQNESLKRCEIPQSGRLLRDSKQAAECLGSAYRDQQASWIQQLTQAGAEEARRPPEQQVALQHRLQTLNFLPPDAAIDGIYGAGTREAILAWQRSNNRAASGFLSDADTEVLMGTVVSPPAQNEVVYHARRETIGCRDPQAVRTVANASALQKNDQQWLNSVERAGSCAHISTEATWTLVSTMGDLAVIKYSGTKAPPASLFVVLSEFTSERVGAQSEQVEAPPAPPAILPNAILPSSTNGRAQPVSPAATQPVFDPATLRSGNAQIAVSAAPSQASVGRPTLASQDPSGGIAVAFLAVLATLAGILIWKTKQTNAALQQTLKASREEIEQNASNLRVKRIQLVQSDQYGTVFLTNWEKEKRYYIDTRIMPLLLSRGLDRWFGQVATKIDAMIEEAAQRPIQPSANDSTRFVSNPEVFDPRMNPVDYERYCALQLERAGWSCRLTAVTGDQGADIIARRPDGKTLVLQCKLYSQPVGNDAVQQVHAARTFQAADLAAVVSNQPFTRSAQQLAQVNGVRLLHHEQLCSFADAQPSPYTP
jgi:restriction system protein